MATLASMAEGVGALLKERKETLAVAESSTGGLIAAALLAVPGASAYFVGGGVIYTGKAREALLEIDLATHAGMRPSTEPYARLCASTIRKRLGTHLGSRRERRDGAERQSLRRRAGPLLRRGLGAARPQHHHRDRAVGPGIQYVALCARGAGAARGGAAQPRGLTSPLGKRRSQPGSPGGSSTLDPAFTSVRTGCQIEMSRGAASISGNAS